jgi:hypothetical protein
MMEAVRTSETSVYNETTRRNIPEDFIFADVRTSNLTTLSSIDSIKSTKGTDQTTDNWRDLEWIRRMLLKACFIHV